MAVKILPFSPRAGPRNLKDRDQHRDLHGNRWKEESLLEKVQVRNLVMGEVKILKRGENYKPGERNVSQDIEKKLEPEYTDDVMSQVRVQDLKHVNARFFGPTFTHSPSPSSVPSPLILLNKRAPTSNVEEAVKT